MRIYAIGDVHGQLGQLRAAHDRIARDRDRTVDGAAPVVHLGDLVDRGPDSRGVLQHLIEGVADGAPWIVLTGNHDRILSEHLSEEGPRSVPLSLWRRADYGGLATMASYGVEPGLFSTESGLRRRLIEAVPEEHRRFLRDRPLTHETSTHLFVHAGIRPGIPLSEQIEHDLLWIRGEFLNDTRDHGRLIVHGHTPVPEPMHCGNRVNLDAGAGFGRPLAAAVFEGSRTWILTDEGRVPLVQPRA